MTDDHQKPATLPDDEISRPSWAPIQIVIIYLILAVTAAFIGKAAGLLILLFLGYSIWSALSKKEYEKMRRSHPGYKRGDYILNSIIFHVVVPWAVILIIIGIVYISKS